MVEDGLLPGAELVPLWVLPMLGQHGEHTQTVKGQWLRRLDFLEAQDDGDSEVSRDNSSSTHRKRNSL